jgi:hypothetical protein
MTPTNNLNKYEQIMKEYSKSLQSIVSVMAMCNKATVSKVFVDDSEVS